MGLVTAAAPFGVRWPLVGLGRPSEPRMGRPSALVRAKSSRQLGSTDEGSSSQRAYRPSMKSMLEPERNVSVGFGMGGVPGGFNLEPLAGRNFVPPGHPQEPGAGGVGR